MPKLLGKAPNQVPTNADLGTMAFQDREGINVNNAIVANLFITGTLTSNAPFVVANSTTTNVAYFAANGNVGIGTNTPTSKLTVYGNTSYFGAFNTVGRTSVIVDSPTAQTASIVYRQGGGNTIDIGTRISNTSVLTIRESASGIERITFVANSTYGAIAINNAAPSTGQAMSVVGNTYFDSERMFLYSVTGNSAPFIQFYTANTSSFEAVRFLHPGGNAAFDAGYDTGSSVYYVNRFDTAGAFVDRSMLISRANGNVGIANNNPDAKLAVTGTANISANVWIGGSTTIAGNLTVSGTTTYINTTTLNIGDNIITLNADVAGGTAPTENAGIEVNRGSAANTSLYWDETNDRWTVADTLQVTTTSTPATGATIARFGTSAEVSRIRVIDENSTGQLPPMITSSSAAYGLGLAADQGTGPIIFYTGGTANTTNERARIAANGNFGIATTTPAEKLVVNGNITTTGNLTANNYRAFVLTRTLSTTVNDTVEIGRMTSTNGAHTLRVVVEVGDTSFSIAKVYDIVSFYNGTSGAGNSNTYFRVLPSYSSGAFGGTQDFDLEAYHNNNDIGLRLRRTAGSTAGIASVTIRDLSINRDGADVFTPASATATGVAAATDYFPGNRVSQGNQQTTGGNNFIVVANSTVNAITANNTQVTFGSPTVFNGGYTITGTAGQTFMNFTTSATTANQVVTLGVNLGSSSWRTVKYLVSVTSGSAYQSTEIVVIHDGTNVYKTEYGTVYSGAVLATFDADINSGNIRLLTTPTNAVTTYRGLVTFVQV